MRLPSEVLKKIEELKISHAKEVFNLKKQYVLDNSPYEVGDIIQDHHQTGRIKSINLYPSVFFENSVDTVYRCERLKKNLEPFKSGEETNIYLSRVKKLIKKG